MKAVIYARYSSDNQREASIEGQIRECTAFAEKNGITVLRHYIDRAISAKTDNRPEFQNMIKDSNKKLFDMIIVWKLDRFARNRYDSARYKAQLKKNGVKVVSATEVISDGAEGIILESMLEGFAEYYSVDLSEKVVRGMTDNALKCMFNGGTLPMGYVIDAEQHFQIDPVTAPYILDAFKQYDEGATMTQIRDWLNEQGMKNTRGNPLTYNSVQHLLKNRRYIGEYQYRDILIPDGIPAIVPKDLFDRVQAKMEKNKKAPARHKAEDDYLLTTKLFCGYCGAYLCGESGTSRTGVVHHYYKCVSVKKKRKECHKKPVKKGWIEDLVVSETMKMIMDDDAIEAIVSMLMELQEQDNTNIPLYERQLQETNTKIRNLINAIQQGVLTKSTKESLEELEAAKEELETRLANEQLSKPPKISAEFMTFWLHRFRKLDVTKQSHRKMLIDTFINAIYLYDDKMLITFNYKDGTKKITFSEIQEASKRDASGSDLECSPAPNPRFTNCEPWVFCCNKNRLSMKKACDPRRLFLSFPMVWVHASPCRHPPSRCRQNIFPAPPWSIQWRCCCCRKLGIPFQTAGGIHRDIPALPPGPQRGRRPPTPCPIKGSTSSGEIILAFVPNCARYLALSIFASPAATIKIGSPSAKNDSVFAIRQGSQPNAWAANATVALGNGKLPHPVFHAKTPEIFLYFFNRHKKPLLLLFSRPKPEFLSACSLFR